MNNITSPTHKRAFKPAMPAPWLISAAQQFVRAELALNNKIFLDAADLNVFDSIPKGSGTSLTSNHADETDPRVVVELSRRSGKRFISMCNREAFDENFGIAGWALQRLGHFSVERGAHDSNAKTFAIDVIKEGRDILVIFPEGEIFYMNEVVQPFHSGAIDLSMQAIVDKRKTDPTWTSFLVPMAIKYHYDPSVVSILENRIARIEKFLSITPSGAGPAPGHPSQRHARRGLRHLLDALLAQPLDQGPEHAAPPRRTRLHGRPVDREDRRMGAHRPPRRALVAPRLRTLTPDAHERRCQGTLRRITQLPAPLGRMYSNPARSKSVRVPS